MEQNDRIQEIQGNWNVFVDYPELAWKLFGLSAPNGMTTPTKAGCTHTWQETSRHETCAQDGAFTLSCSVCGDVYSRRLAPLAHTDADDNEYCDVCTKPLAVFADLKPVTALSDGMHFAVWNPASGLIIGSKANNDHKPETSGAHPHGRVLLEVTGVTAENMDKTITVTIRGMEEGGNTITFNGNAFAKVMANSSSPVQQNLGAALYNYGFAAKECFGA